MLVKKEDSEGTDLEISDQGGKIQMHSGGGQSQKTINLKSNSAY